MLQAGFARVDITPPFGNDLSGYYERRLADGTLDPLYLNAVAVTSGEETVILMAADYIGIRLAENKALRTRISERTGVPVDHILIAALHQHTAPCLADLKTRPTALNDPSFMDVLYRLFGDAAVMAMDDRCDATYIHPKQSDLHRYFQDIQAHFFRPYIFSQRERLYCD